MLTSVKNIRWQGDLQYDNRIVKQLEEANYEVEGLRIEDLRMIRAAVMYQIGLIRTEELRKSAIRLLDRPAVYFAEGGEIHHFGKLGLAKHLYEVASFSMILLGVVPEVSDYVSKDALIYCGLLHDIGKTFDDPEGVDLTTYWVKHCTVGKFAVMRDLTNESSLSQEQIAVLGSIIFSHHLDVRPRDDDPVRNEYEALIIHLADMHSTSYDRIARYYKNTLPNISINEKFIRNIKPMFEQ